MARSLKRFTRFIDELPDMQAGSGQQERGMRRKAGAYPHLQISRNPATVSLQSQELVPATSSKALEASL